MINDIWWTMNLGWYTVYNVQRFFLLLFVSFLGSLWGHVFLICWVLCWELVSRGEMTSVCCVKILSRLVRRCASVIYTTGDVLRAMFVCLVACNRFFWGIDGNGRCLDQFLVLNIPRNFFFDSLNGFLFKPSISNVFPTYFLVPLNLNAFSQRPHIYIKKNSHKFFPPKKLTDFYSSTQNSIQIAPNNASSKNVKFKCHRKKIN